MFDTNVATAERINNVLTDVFQISQFIKLLTGSIMICFYLFLTSYFTGLCFSIILQRNVWHFNIGLGVVLFVEHFEKRLKKKTILFPLYYFFHSFQLKMSLACFWFQRSDVFLFVFGWSQKRKKKLLFFGCCYMDHLFFTCILFLTM